ncbi:hypothetical protein VHUM_00705 [Vanrija humicola]|uniref:Uncharacterized protein n=1 Tax=Vanrija humicola TaxID=5417 RepID=A0A7D8V499_VANHU|nr:hypothetical protein VHUM_00705 [Vanrija humicola]
MSALVQLPAGRSFRRSQEAKWVDPQPEKGTIELSLDQGIINFVWRNAETSRAEDELLIFPGEAEFERVAKDPSGRSFVLKFNSSNQVHFFWLQRGTLGESDARAAVDINSLLQDPSYRPSAPAKPSAAATAAGLAAGLAGAATSSSTAAGSSDADVDTRAITKEDVKNQDMARLLFHWADQHLPIPEEEEASLTDILTPEVVSRLVEERPELAKSLAQHMPPDLTLPEGTDTKAGLLRVVGTPQFRDAVGNLEMALRNGTLPESMMPFVHLPEDAAWSLKNFLTALREVKDGDQTQEPEDGDEKMDTD